MHEDANVVIARLAHTSNPTSFTRKRTVHPREALAALKPKMQWNTKYRHRTIVQFVDTHASNSGKEIIPSVADRASQPR